MYTKEQLVEAMKKYYESGLANPENYEWGIENLDPARDAEIVVDILINYVENQ